MPYANPTAAKLSNRERQRRYRARQKAAKQSAAVLSFPTPADPIGALARLPQLARDFGEFGHNRDHNYLFSLQPHSISLCSADLAY